MWCCRMSYGHFAEPAKEELKKNKLDYSQIWFIYTTIMVMDIWKYVKLLHVAIHEIISSYVFLSFQISERISKPVDPLLEH